MIALRIAGAFAAAIMVCGFQTIEGTAEGRDGDDIYVKGKQVRLWGIDAPEFGQACRDAHGTEYCCGADAKAHLAKLVNGKHVRCIVKFYDVFKRPHGVCHIGELNIGEKMLFDGMARGSQYRKAENDARKEPRGIWRGTSRPPAAWLKKYGTRFVPADAPCVY